MVKLRKFIILWLRLLGQNSFGFITFFVVLASQAIFICECLLGLSKEGTNEAYLKALP
jgi:hypothetical protein